MDKIHNLHEIHYKNMLSKKIYVINVENKTIQMIANEVNDIVINFI